MSDLICTRCYRRPWAWDPVRYVPNPAGSRCWWHGCTGTLAVTTRLFRSLDPYPMDLTDAERHTIHRLQSEQEPHSQLGRVIELSAQAGAQIDRGERAHRKILERDALARDLWAGQDKLS